MTDTSETTVLSVARALVILKYLAESEEEIGVRDLSHALGYSPAVTQKLLNTLKAHHFVEQNEETERYQLGLGVVNLGLTALHRLDVIKVARPKLEMLMHETDETIFLAIRDDTTTVYVDKIESTQPIRMNADVGVHRPLNCTAVGKVLLAFSEPGTVAHLAESDALIAATENSITNPNELEEELERIREQGYALDNEEFHSGVLCVAAPIFGADGSIKAALTAAGPTFRMQGNLQGIISSVQSVAATISHEMGYTNEIITE